MTHTTPQFTLTEAGRGRPALILHGGGGPFTVAPIAAHLAPTMHTLLPTHPGWSGTARPGDVLHISDLTRLYLELLEARDLRDVLVIGSSLGGWIAADLAARDWAGRVSGLVLLDAVGLEVPGEPIRDFFSLDARGVSEYSYADPERFYVDPAALSEEQRAARRANLETMRVYAGAPYMHDPELRARLPQVRAKVLVVWGEADRIVTPAYGRAFAAAIPGARYEEIARAGHLPQLERPEETFRLIDAFAVQTRPA